MRLFFVRLRSGLINARSSAASVVPPRASIYETASNNLSSQMRFSFASFFFVLNLALGLSLKTQAQELPVRVRIVGGEDQLQLKAKGPVVLDRTGVRIDFSHSTAPHTIFLKWNLSESEGHLRVVPEKKGSRAEISQELQFPLEIRGQELEYAGVKVPSHLWVNYASGQFELIALLSFNDYLLGVLPREMPSAWPLEALRAQAIAARSYAHAQIRLRASETYHVESTVLDQDFRFIPETERNQASIVVWQRVIEETNGQVMQTPDGHVLKAFYHSDCGGMTTTPDLVWGSREPHRGVKDPACLARASNAWQFTVAKEWLLSQLSGQKMWNGSARKFTFGWLPSLADGRVALIEWARGIGDHVVLTGQSFRRLLGFSNLKSTLFQTEDLGSTVRFRGKGYGHGVGLCQWGARDWAEKGLSANEILRHYYPLAQVVMRGDTKLSISWSSRLLQKSSKFQEVSRPPVSTTRKARAGL